MLYSRATGLLSPDEGRNGKAEKQSGHHKLLRRERKVVVWMAFELAMLFLPPCTTALWVAQPYVPISLNVPVKPAQDTYVQPVNQSPDQEEPIIRPDGTRLFVRTLADGFKVSDILGGSARNRVEPPGRQNLAEPKFTLADDGLNKWIDRYRIRRSSWRYLIRHCSGRLAMAIQKLFVPLEKLLSQIFLVFGKGLGIFL